MEMLKWLEPEDLLNSTAVRSVQLREVSDSDELWRCQFPEPADSGSVAAKRFYSEKLRQKAYIVLRKSLFAYLCPLGRGQKSLFLNRPRLGSLDHSPLTLFLSVALDSDCPPLTLELGLYRPKPSQSAQEPDLCGGNCVCLWGEENLPRT